MKQEQTRTIGMMVGLSMLALVQPSGLSNSESAVGFQGNQVERISGGSVFGKGVRTYSPSLRRFLAFDGVGYSPMGAGGLNAQAYVDDNINLTDPMGHAPPDMPEGRKNFNVIRNGFENIEGAKGGKDPKRNPTPVLPKPRSTVNARKVHTILDQCATEVFNAFKNEKFPNVNSLSKEKQEKEQKNLSKHVMKVLEKDPQLISAIKQKDAVKLALLGMNTTLHEFLYSTLHFERQVSDSDLHQEIKFNFHMSRRDYKNESHSTNNRPPIPVRSKTLPPINSREGVSELEIRRQAGLVKNF